VGILKDHFAPQTETYSTLPFFEHLDRDLFEIILYSVNVLGHKLEEYCRSHADRLVGLPGDMAERVNTIRSDDLDIILIAISCIVLSLDETQSETTTG
jgi:predicted O-linked N-acetylglucosamine transferase (SPINDLY family)